MATSDHTTNSGIYIIRNLKNGKFYIGQSQNIRERWAEHKRTLNKNIHKNKHLQAAWNKYGAKVFKFLVLEYCDISKLDEREQVQLDAHAQSDNCYNIAIDAKAPMRGQKLSAETKARMSARLKGHAVSNETRRKIAEKSRNISDETRQRMSNTQSNRSPETRQKIREAHLGKPRSNETILKMSIGRRGIKHTEETKQRIAEAGRNRAPISEDTRARMREAQSHCSEETRQKRREIMQGKPSPMQGKVMSDEHKRKIGEANKLRHAERRAQKERTEQEQVL